MSSVSARLKAFHELCDLSPQSYRRIARLIAATRRAERLCERPAPTESRVAAPQRSSVRKLEVAAARAMTAGSALLALLA
jgi:hypothetical protein